MQIIGNCKKNRRDGHHAFAEPGRDGTVGDQYRRRISGPYADSFRKTRQII